MSQIRINVPRFSELSRSSGAPSDSSPPPHVRGLRKAQENSTSTLWQPDPLNSPQQLAYASQADILGYGGAAGGGKTDLAIGCALTKHRRSIIFRREYPQLKDIIGRAVEAVGDDRGLNRNEGIMRGIPGDRVLEFGSMQYEDSRNKYKGRPKDLMVFDEATEFTESQVRFVMTWNRTTTPGQRCQTILTFNPPTDPDGEWVIDFFAPWLDEEHPNPAKPGELRWFVSGDDGDIEVGGPEPVELGGRFLYPQSRTFIPARVEDNRFLMATGYDRKLDNLPAELREIMRYGIMRRAIKDAPLQLIPREWVVQAQKRWEDFHASGAELGVPLTQTGADVSRGGKDRTTVVNRYGSYFAAPKVYQGEVTDDGLKTAALILEENDGEAPVAVDAIGVGTSTYDHLKENHPHVVPLNGSEKSGHPGWEGKHEYAFDRSGKYKLANKRTEWHWRFMEALDPVNGDDLMLPPGADLRKQICAPRFKLTPGGVRIELKEEIKGRLGESPDVFEAILYAHAEIEVVNDLTMTDMMAAMQAAARPRKR